MNTKTILVILGGFFGIFVLAGVLLWRFGAQPPQVDSELILGGSRNVRGEGVHVVVEFSDFQCPACAATQPALEELKQQYGDRFKLVYRHYPLSSIHPNALRAAHASEAAGRQGKFWEYHDILFTRQEEWKDNKNDDNFLSYAQELGLSVEQFKNDIESEEIRGVVAKDSLDANRLRLSGTPSFFLDGEKVTIQDLIVRLGSL